MNLKKWKGIFMSKFVGIGPSSYEKRIYRAAVSLRLRNTGIYHTSINSRLPEYKPLVSKHVEDINNYKN